MRQDVHFTPPAQEATWLDYLHEVEHVAERIVRLERAIADAVQAARPSMRAVIAAWQALRGVAQISAVTIVADVGQLTRFTTARQLMSHSGAAPREHSSGARTRRGAIFKTGNAHLRRIVVEAAWAYWCRTAVGPALRRRQEAVSAEVKTTTWKAQHRLCARYRTLLARGKCKQQVVTAVARELLGFIWAIGVAAEATSEGRRAA